MVGRDKGMNKVDVAKWSLGDLSDCENLGRQQESDGTFTRRDGRARQGERSNSWEDMEKITVCNAKLLITVACVALAFPLQGFQMLLVTDAWRE